MSRYMLNKLMWEVERNDDDLAAFIDDPAGFVATWQRRYEAPVSPYPLGGVLTEEEREACVDADYVRLYAMGAHPYLLWHFVRAVYVPDPMTVSELSDALKEAVALLERPDFAT